VAKDSGGNSFLDASAVVSGKCFEAWKQKTKPSSDDHEKGFQRALTAHLTRSDGRRPFSPQEEAAVLQVVRQKKVWPAFQGTGFQIDRKGFRSTGFHERFEESSSWMPGYISTAHCPIDQIAIIGTLPFWSESVNEAKQARFGDRRMIPLNNEIWEEPFLRLSDDDEPFQPLVLAGFEAPTPEPLLSPVQAARGQARAFRG
jgi:hypothetical protein